MRERERVRERERERKRKRERECLVSLSGSVAPIIRASSVVSCNPALPRNQGKSKGSTQKK